MTESDVEAIRERLEGEIDDVLDEMGRRHGVSTANPAETLAALNTQAKAIARLQADRERLMGALHRDDDSEDGAGLIPAVDWMLDILEMYEDRLKDFGDPPELVHSDVNEAAKAKARRDLRAARDLLDEMEGGEGLDSRGYDEPNPTTMNHTGAGSYWPNLPADILADTLEFAAEQAEERLSEDDMAPPAIREAGRRLREAREGEGPRCEKCGSDDLSTRWKPEVEKSYERGYKGCRNLDEHLHRVCRNCQYEWDDPPRTALSTREPEPDREGGGDG